MATSTSNTASSKRSATQGSGSQADRNAEQVSETLKKDNESILLLLDILRRQQQLLTGKRTPDYAALGSIVEFVDHYQSSIQQPREELLFRALELGDSAVTTKQKIDTLRTDNEKIERELQAVDERVSAIRAGEQRANKKLLHDKLQDLTRMMTEHVDSVQQTLLPIAKRVLSASDWETMRIRIQYLEQEEPTRAFTAARRDEATAVEEDNAKTETEAVSKSMTLRQLLSPVAVVESTVAWWRGVSRLGSIARHVLQGETEQLKGIRPVVTETAAATIQPYKTRVHALGNLLTRQLRA